MLLFFRRLHALRQALVLLVVLASLGAAALIAQQRPASHDDLKISLADALPVGMDLTPSPHGKLAERLPSSAVRQIHDRVIADDAARVPASRRAR